MQQNEIAKRLGVSSTPVREAFGILQAEGLLVLRPHRGVTVAQSRPVRFEEAVAIYEIRHVIEKLSLRRIIEGQESDLLRELAYVIETGQEAYQSKDFVKFRYSLSEFHRVLSKGTGSALLSTAISPLNAQAQFFATGLDHDGLRHSHQAHVAILEALLEGDLGGVLQLEDEHFRQNVQRLEDANLEG